MQEENITLNESLSCTDPHLTPVMEFQNTRETRPPLHRASSFTVLVPPRPPPRRQTTTVTYLPSSRPWHAVNVALHFLFPSSRLRRLRKYRGLRAFRSTIGSVEFLVARMQIHVYIVFLLIEIRCDSRIFLQLYPLHYYLDVN